MKQRFRLKRRQDFDRVMGGRRVFAGRTLVAFALPNPDGRWRVGVAISRQLRGAAARNRLRRRLREAARVNLLPQDSDVVTSGKAYDMVLIGRPAGLEVPHPVLEEEVARVRSRLRGGNA
ncbi:MAG TPA: ribonuclease P protein component [Candidatus Dormibacteraeota bacterium]|nr:ribonuclease P protein component [Candidatus Dormibacteraeota bacterium]